MRCDDCGRRFDRPSFYAPCAHLHPQPTLSQSVANAVEGVVTNRRGLRQVWDGLDDDVKDDIRDQWAELIFNLLEDVM